jgi:hypothetical protein
MTDNAFAYAKNRSLPELLSRRAIGHVRTRPYTRRTNGKVCVLASRCRPVGRRGSPLLLV